MCAFQRTGSRIFSNEKLPQLHSISSISLNLPFYCPELSTFEVNEQEKKTTEDKNLDLRIDFAIDDTRCALCECEKCHVRTYESVLFTAHAAVPYARIM